MEFWIIENGEKRGPFPDYTLREMIRENKVTASTRVWHDGAEGWKAAREVTILEREFETAVEDQETVAPPQVSAPPPLPRQVDWGMMWRRLGARWLDYSLAIFFFFLVVRASNIPLSPDDPSEVSGWVILLQFVPALIFEGILLHYFSRTPGKWFMGLTVKNHEGVNLGLGAAVMRSMRIWVLGLGMAIPPLFFIGHVIAWWIVKRNGAPLWDLMTGFRVGGAIPSARRIVFFFMALVLIWVAIFWLRWPEMEPHFEEAMEKAQAQSLK